MYETAAERAGAASRTALEMAATEFELSMWDIFKEFPHLVDEIGGVHEAFRAAFERMQAEGIGIEEAFVQELAKLPGLTGDALRLVQEAFSEAMDDIDTTIDVVGLEDSFRGLAESLGAAFSKTGGDIEGIFKDIQDVSKMFLEGWDIDIADSLSKIPGMTSEFVDAITEELKALKEAGVTEFELGAPFEERFRTGFEAPEEYAQQGMRYGGMLWPDMGAITEGLKGFEDRLAELGISMSGFAINLTNLDQQQADAILDLIDVEKTALNQERLMNKSAVETRAALLELTGAALMSEDEFNALTAGQRSFLGELIGFDFDNYIGALSWDDFIRGVNLGHYVTPAPGFAGGTSFAPGGMALIGERGPEVIHIPRGSQIIPNNKIKGMGVNINRINIRIMGDIRTEQDYTALERRLAQSVKNALARV